LHSFHAEVVSRLKEKLLILFLEKKTKKMNVFVPKLWNERRKSKASILQQWNEWKKTYLIVPEL
jgi:hypothetical protein